VTASARATTPDVGQAPVPEDSKTKLAEDRTDLAEDRTILANERTFAGWMRTGFAAVGVGLGFQALFNKMEPDWVPKGIATAFLLIAMIVFWTASGAPAR
jgi:putative membrane protein